MNKENTISQHLELTLSLSFQRTENSPKLLTCNTRLEEVKKKVSHSYHTDHLRRKPPHSFPTKYYQPTKNPTIRLPPQPFTNIFGSTPAQHHAFLHSNKINHFIAQPNN